jgi:hypothetical protein
MTTTLTPHSLRVTIALSQHAPGELVHEITLDQQTRPGGQDGSSL